MLKISALSPIFLAVAFVSIAHADPVIPEPRPVHRDTLAPHVGILAGIADANGSPKPAFDYGVDVGVQPYVPFGVGLQYSRFSTGDSSTGEGITRNSLLAKASYNFGGTVPVLRSSYVGFKIGPVFEEVNTHSRTRLGLAPMIGFDETICDHFTGGLEGAYLAVIGPDSADHWSLNAAFKYWF